MNLRQLDKDYSINLDRVLYIKWNHRAEYGNTKEHRVYFQNESNYLAFEVGSQAAQRLEVLFYDPQPV